MKAIFIAYNQAYNQEIVQLLEGLGQRGYTVWEEIGGWRKRQRGRGTASGEPCLAHAEPCPAHRAGRQPGAQGDGSAPGNGRRQRQAGPQGLCPSGRGSAVINARSKPGIYFIFFHYICRIKTVSIMAKVATNSNFTELLPPSWTRLRKKCRTKSPW